VTEERNRPARSHGALAEQVGTKLFVGCGATFESPRCESCGAARVAGGHHKSAILSIRIDYFYAGP